MTALQPLDFGPAPDLSRAGPQYTPCPDWAQRTYTPPPPPPGLVPRRDSLIIPRARANAADIARLRGDAEGAARLRDAPPPEPAMAAFTPAAQARGRQTRDTRAPGATATLTARILAYLNARPDPATAADILAAVNADGRSRALISQLVFDGRIQCRTIAGRGVRGRVGQYQPTGRPWPDPPPGTHLCGRTVGAGGTP